MLFNKIKLIAQVIGFATIAFLTLDELLGFLRRQAEDPEVLGQRAGA